VINEIMYHPPEDGDHLQFVELFNPDPTPANLSGWSFSKGLEFNFPTNTLIAPNGFLVIARNPAAFARHYRSVTNVLGPFKGKLKHSGERLELLDANAKTVESLKFEDQQPWPLAPDGYGSSLERILPSAPAQNPANWAPSKLPASKVSTGSPGRQNDSFTPQPPPSIQQITASTPSKSHLSVVQCTITDPKGLRSAHLRVVPWSGNQPGQELLIPLTRTDGSPLQGRYQASIPPQIDGTLVRTQIVATNEVGAVAIFPHPNEPNPTLSFYSGSNTNTAAVPFAFIRMLGPAERRGSSLRFRPNAPNRSPAEAVRGNAAFVWVPTNGAPIQVFDHVRVVQRQGGWKVHFRKDQPLQGMTGLNLVFEFAPRQVLSEHLSYELFRKAGSLTPHSEHVRVWMDGRPHGYFLAVEQPNKNFLKRNQRNEDSNIYKLLWYGQGLEAQHEKKTNLDTGHDDLRALMKELEGSRGAAQWAVIQKHFSVPEFANYYAINQCIQNWDGYFNNYSIYHDLKPGGKWGIIPWDEDKTWGDYDGASANYDWYELPLNYGMRGDKGPTDLRSLFNQGPFGGTSWWRPPGWFSGPLLANPDFRKVFLKRLDELCNTAFTDATFTPVINALEKRLGPEVEYRAAIMNQDPAAEKARFKRHIESFRRQLQNRRKFLLTELEKAK